MARYHPTPDELPLVDQVKALADEELLDFWEETQHLEKFLESELPLNIGSTLEYERAILQELRYRSSLRSLPEQR